MHGGKNTWNFSCGACGESFSRESDDFDKKITAPITRGPEFCYVGPHTVKRIKAGDERRVIDDALVLTSGPDLQRQIDSIPSTMPKVRILTIQSPGYYDEESTTKLEVSMPNLETLKLIDVSFKKVTLNPSLTPNVEELSMQNVGDDCDLTVRLPELKSFEMHYYCSHDDSSWVHEMLATAKKLERFDTYKFRVWGRLDFAGNDLRSIRLHRAECTTDISLYAPRIEHLSLQACYGLDGELRILESHPNFAKPVGRPSSFVVDTTNACVSPRVAEVLRTNPRIEWVGQDEDDFSGNPCEGMFARMHAGMGF